MNALVIGSSGFVGQALTKRLQQNHVSYKDIPGPNHGGIKLTDYGSVYESIKQCSPQSIVYLSAQPDAPHSPKQLRQCIDTNILGLAHVCEAAKLLNTRHIIHIGSLKQYGDTPTPFTESKPKRPKSIYALTKMLAEDLLGFYSRSFNLRTVSLRAASLYGPGKMDKKLLIREVIENCLKNAPVASTLGEQKRDFLYVEDFVDLLMLVIQDRDHSGIYNVASGNEISIRHTIEMIHRLTQSQSMLQLGKIPYRKTEIWSMETPIEKITNAFNWTPSTSLEQGLQKTIEYLKNGNAL